MMDGSTRRIDQLRDQAVWEARREINLRIVLQNGVLCLHTTIITILLIIQITFSVNPWLVWLVGIMSSTVLAQIWLHSGVRHAQFRRYFEDVLDADTTHGLEGWESFLERMHPESSLGTRWWIRTKAVFAFTQLGFGLVAIASSVLVGQSFGAGIGILVVGILFGMFTLSVLHHPPLPAGVGATEPVGNENS